MTLDEQVNQEIVNFGGLINGFERYDNAKPTEKGGIANSAAYGIAQGDQEAFYETLNKITQSDTAYVTFVKKNIKNSSGIVEPLYEANKGSIVDYVAEQINVQLAEAKAKIESGDHARIFTGQDAIKTVAKILGPVLNVRKPDQSYAHTLKTRRLAEITRVDPGMFVGVNADPDAEYDILIRTIAAEFVTGGNKVDAGKLGELMNYETGSRLYATAKQMEERAAYKMAA